MSLKLFPTAGCLGGNSPRGAIWNFCYLNECQSSPLSMYAIPLIASEECLLDGSAYPNNNDLLRSMLINECASGSLQSYYELVRGNDLSAWAEFLLHRKRLCGIHIKKRILSELPERRRLGELSSGGIFTTGLPQEDANRYHSSLKV